MKREVLDALVGEDLDHIPRGDLDQNILRSIHNMQRRHDLAEDPATPWHDSLVSAVAAIRKDNPAFEPTYLAEHFADETESMKDERV